MFFCSSLFFRWFVLRGWVAYVSEASPEVRVKRNSTSAFASALRVLERVLRIFFFGLCCFFVCSFGADGWQI